MRLDPMDDHVVLKPIDGDPVTRGGIIIPDNAKEKSMRGVVRAVGPGRVLESGARVEPTLKVDDVVIYTKYAGTELKVEGEEVLVLRERDVLCRIVE
jgi:chaperonin GroES